MDWKKFIVDYYTPSKFQILSFLFAFALGSSRGGVACDDILSIDSATLVVREVLSVAAASIMVGIHEAGISVARS